MEHVFLVGVAGAVPHYTDFERHVRLGDVVMATPPIGQGQQFIYQFCQSVKEMPSGEVQFETKSWCPVDLGLQDIQQSLVHKFNSKGGYEGYDLPWLAHYKEGLAVLCDHEPEDNDTDGLGFVDDGWLRPSSDSDKLYMSMGGGDVIEVGHPTPRDGQFDPRYTYSFYFLCTQSLNLDTRSDKVRINEDYISFFFSVSDIKASLCCMLDPLLRANL